MTTVLIIFLLIVVLLAVFFAGLAVGVRGFGNVIAEAIDTEDIPDELKVYLLERLVINHKFRRK